MRVSTKFKVVEAYVDSIQLADSFGLELHAIPEITELASTKHEQRAKKGSQPSCTNVQNVLSKKSLEISGVEVVAQRVRDADQVGQELSVPVHLQRGRATAGLKIAE